MKTVTSILIGLLLAGLAGAGYFYMVIFKPLTEDVSKFKAAQPEVERSRIELKKFQEREKLEAAWITPAVEALKKGLDKEISGGKAEIVVVDNRIVVNIAESVLFTPRSVTFGGKESLRTLETLAPLLKDFKDKEILVGNMTLSDSGQGGRRKAPTKDGRTLASARSVELVKYLVKNGVSEELLVASSYPSRLPDRGFRIKAQKTIILISSPVSAAQTAPARASQAAPAAPPAAVKPSASTPSTPTAAPAAPAPASSPQKPIPITTAPPKKVR